MFFHNVTDRYFDRINPIDLVDIGTRKNAGAFDPIPPTVLPDPVFSLMPTTFVDKCVFV